VGTVIYLGFRILETTVGALPRRLAYRLGVTLGFLAFRLWRTKREALLANLRHVLPNASDAELRAVAQRNLVNSVKAWIDFFQVPHLPRRRLEQLLATQGEDQLEQALRLGRGVLVVSVHLGSWEIAAASWASAHGPVGLLAEQIQPRAVYERFVRIRSSMGIRVIPLARTAVREMLRLLSENRAVCVAMDRDILRTGEPFRFFDATTSIPTGAVEIALKTGAPILPAFCLRQPDDTYLAVGEPFFVIDSTGDRRRDVHAGVERLLRIFERHIRAHPDQWHVLEPLWPATPRPLSSELTPAPGEVPVPK
jgi:KDO2-lipid IV(A) lauroyltransferase